MPYKMTNESKELRALASGPSRQTYPFRSMTSFGSHYRMELEEDGMHHATFDSGIGVLDACRRGEDSSDNCVSVELKKVGVLKDIVALNYGHMSIVLMVVSWVAKDTKLWPRLHRDAHGFWLTNMVAMPCDTTEPYLFPAFAS